MDEQLHAERVAPESREQLQHRVPLDELPDGAFVLEGGDAWLVVGTQLLKWTPAGYTVRKSRPVGEIAHVVTPPSLIAVLRADRQPVVPLLHPSVLR